VTSPEIVKKAPAPNSSRWRGRLPRLLPLVVGLGLLTLILSRTDLARLGAVLIQVQWQWYALAQLMLVVNLLLITSRWRYDLGLLKLSYPFGELFLVDNAGALAGAATPGRMGDLARLIYFRQEKHLLLRIGLSILVERFLDLTVLVWLCAVFLWFFPLPVEFKRLVLNLVLGAILVGLGIIVIAWRFWGWEWLNTRVLRLIPKKITERFSGSAQELQAALRCYGTWRLVWPLTLTFLAWGFNILAAHLSARSLALPLSLWQTGACFCLSTLFTLIPLSVAGIGTRELAMVFLFSCLELPSEQALAFSFLLLGFLLTHSLVGFLALLLKPPHT
jgi:glycosyltransferase 2 family protein